MPLVPLRPLMEAAEQHGYAQGAFNVNAVAQAKAVIEMHETCLLYTSRGSPEKVAGSPDYRPSLPDKNQGGGFFQGSLSQCHGM